MATGTKAADLFVDIGYDLSNYRKGLQAAKTEGLSFTQQLKQALNDPAGFAGTSKIAGLISDLKLGRSIIPSLKTAAEGLGGSLRGLTVNALHASLNGVKNVLGGLKGALGSVFQGLGIGAGIVSFQALGRAISDVLHFIPDLIEKGKAYGNLVDQIGDSTGATAQQSSRLAGTLLYLGAPIDGIISLIGQMSRNLQQAEVRLNALGIATKDASGATLNQVQILENARQAFSRFGDGTDKARQIAIEFGRGGLKILVDYLKLTDEQAAKVTADLQAQGLILTESQRNLAETATRESARFQNALTGLGVALFTTVGPQINAFFSNLTNFIVAHVEDIRVAVSSAISFILGLVGSLVGMSDSLDSFSAAIERGNAATSPYSAGIAQLTAQIAELGDTTDTTTDSTAAQRKAIDGQIKSVDGQVAALKKLETQQDKTYTKALAAITQVLDAQGKLLDAEDAAAARADRDLALTNALRDAKISLFEAQAKLRADALAGKPTDQDTLAVAKAQQGILDAQKAIADEATSRARDQRRAELGGVKEYIASVAKLLEDADNKQAALNTLKRREAVLTAREAAQLAAGDITGAGDTHAKIEALKTTETKAQQDIRNGVQQSALDRQKAQLQEELSNISSTAKSATQIKKDELQKQLDALIAQETAWAKLTGKERDDTDVVTAALNAPKTGLTDALKEASAAGRELGTTIKTALGNLAEAFSGVLGFLGQIKSALDEIANSDVWKFLNQPVNLMPAGPLGTDITPEIVAKMRADGIPEDVIDKFYKALTGKTLPPPETHSKAAGGWAPSGLYRLSERGREYVMDNRLSEKLDRFFSTPQMPALATAGGPSATHVHHTHVYLNGREIANVVDRELGFRSGR